MSIYPNRGIVVQGPDNRQYDRFGRRENRLHFLAQELCHTLERYDQYPKEAATTFNHIVRELLGLYFGQNNRPGSAGLKSVRARSIVAGKEKGETVSDHVIPLKFFQDCLLTIVKKSGDGRKAVEKVEGFIRRNAYVVRISAKEDKRLKGEGLQETMPDGWKDGDSPWERYRKAKIQVVDRNGNEVN